MKPPEGAPDHTAPESDETLAQRGEPQIVFSSRRHPKWRIHVWHTGLERYEKLEDQDPVALEVRAARRMAAMDREWRKREKPS